MMDDYEKQARELLEEVLISHGRGDYTTAADDAAVRNLIPKLRAAAEQARAEERSRILMTLQESANAVRKMKLMQTNSTELQKYAADSIEAAIDIIRARGAKP